MLAGPGSWRFVLLASAVSHILGSAPARSVRPSGDCRDRCDHQRRSSAPTTAFDRFLEKYQAKYQAACECFRKDRDVLLAFYDFPAERWKHLRTTNPIESTLATIRLRHRRTKGSGSRRASLVTMFKLAQAAQKR